MVFINKPVSPQNTPNVAGPAPAKADAKQEKAPAAPAPEQQPEKAELVQLSQQGSSSVTVGLVESEPDPGLSRCFDSKQMAETVNMMENYLSGMSAQTFIAIPGAQEKHFAEMGKLREKIVAKLGSLSHEDRLELASRLVGAKRSEQKMVDELGKSGKVSLDGLSQRVFIYESLLDCVFGSSKH